MPEVEIPASAGAPGWALPGSAPAGWAGRRVIGFCAVVRGLGAFALITLAVGLRKFGVATGVIRPLVEQEIFRVGIRLLPMFLFAALALGFLVIGQTVAVLSRVGAASELLGSIMVIVVVRELGPLFTAFLVLGRVGTANVVELGMARALGEVESLEAVGVDPVHYFVVPRVVGMMIGTVSLTVYLILGALGSGYLWAFVQELPVQPADYFSQLAGALTALDFVLLALKTASFGFIIAIVTCFFGLAQPLQLEQISRATVRAVGWSVVACVLLDALFIIAYLTL
ncbi:MAG TPA: ABC transporter permease [Verrucomicrobiota bacterium]|nr:ABC transporter permease [Verrucomicrobiota bacterium]HNT13637.1 ABC transporter permease [Verrucomicrobiota bacterium]